MRTPSRLRLELDRVLPRAGGAWLALPALALVCFFVLPLAALLWRALPDLPRGLSSAMAAESLRLSLLTSLITTAIAIMVGTPAAYLLARYRFAGQAALNTLVDLPTVLPPAVAGLALLMAFGRRGLLGGVLDEAGVALPFTTAAVVVAQTFVAAPFYIRGARVGFAGVDRRLEQIAATLGVSSWGVFRRVRVPLAGRGLLSGALMTWARALGEFGATIMFAGNFQGRTQTMPLAIYIGLQEDPAGALALASVLLVVSFSLLVIVRLLTGRGVPDA